MLYADLNKTLTAVMRAVPKDVEVFAVTTRTAYSFETDMPVTVEIHLVDPERLEEVAEGLGLSNDRRITNAYAGDVAEHKAHVLAYARAEAKSGGGRGRRTPQSAGVA